MSINLAVVPDAGIYMGDFPVPVSEPAPSDGEITETIYDYSTGNPHTTAGVLYCVLNDAMDTIVKSGSVDPNGSGEITITGAELVAGSYITVYKSAAGNQIDSERYTIT